MRLVEELILLLFRDVGYRPGHRLWRPGLYLRAHDGEPWTLPKFSLDYAIAGAVLMELAMEDRIDTDLTALILLNSTLV